LSNFVAKNLPQAGQILAILFIKRLATVIPIPKIDWCGAQRAWFSPDCETDPTSSGRVEECTSTYTIYRCWGLRHYMHCKLSWVELCAVMKELKFGYGDFTKGW